MPAPGSSSPSTEIAAALRGAVDTGATRAARRQRFEQNIPAPRRSIVAWVDILGFKDQIGATDTREAYQIAYRQLRSVQEEFAHATASAEPDQASINEGMGKRIIALSDGLVIALDIEGDCAAMDVLGYFERVRLFLNELLIAQAHCAYRGILIRGGIAEGDFWFEDDILVSPPLVKAYEMETKVAKNPVIILPRSLATRLRLMEAEERDMSDPYPVSQMFRDCEWLSGLERCDYVMLHYMPVLLDEDDPAATLQRFHKTLNRAREAAPECASAKFDWLLKYAKEAEKHLAICAEPLH